MMPYCSCDLLHTRAPQSDSEEIEFCTRCLKRVDQCGNCNQAPQAAISETVKLVDELIEEAIKEGGTLGVRWETLKIIKAGIEPWWYTGV